MINNHHNKIRFDLSNKNHIESYRKFLLENKWENGCPFELEYPWNSIPDMIKDKIVRYYLKV